MKRLSVIVPFRCENQSSIFLLERLEGLCQQFPSHNDIEFMVVDSGSSPEFSELCQAICEKNHINYLFEDTIGKTFSLSSCRDYGVMHAQGKAITFLDVDLRFAPSFWDRLLILMDTWGISEYKKSFFAIPCLYLTQEGTKEFIESENSEIKYQKYYLEYLQGIGGNIENFAACSSVMVVDKLHYLSIGGHNPLFSGHGYEDFELYNRLVVEENILPMPHAFMKDTKTWHTYTFNGFRSLFSLIGRPALMMNLYVYHLWHPRPKNASFYEASKLKANRERIAKAFDDFHKTKKHPLPLIASTSYVKKVLYFSSTNSNTFNILRSIFPLLGSPVCANETDLVHPETLEIRKDIYDYISNLEIDLILFPNPYGNPVRLALYRWCRENQFPYICFDRGALPDSWFFDDNGFNADSASYKLINYNQPLDAEDKIQTQEYIRHCIEKHNPLEKQQEKIGERALLEKLGIQGKKVLFVPLQRPSDSVIKHFIGDIGSFSRFVEVIDILAEKLNSKGWVVLVKKHPLETEQPEFQYAQYVPENTNFIDLISISSAVALINSGVGVYSMMMGKPCYIFGDAFYAIDGVNHKVKLEDYSSDAQIAQLLKLIISNQAVDSEKMLQFIAFLHTEFYSFAVPQVKEVIEADNSLRSLTTGLDFYDIKLFQHRVTYLKDKRDSIKMSAPLLERYGLDIINKQRAAKANESAPKPAAVKKSEPVNKKTVSDLKINSPAHHPKSRKWQKLRYRPYEFFNDTKITILRPLKNFFKK